LKHSIEIQFLGAAGTVTGSRTLVTFGGTRVLVDCGLFQGPRSIRERNWEAFPEDPHRIEAVLLTHAHLDHSGFLPRLLKGGFAGPVYCSAGTADLLKILLLDSAKIQEEDADFANRTQHSRHRPALALYTREDVEDVLGKLKILPDQGWTQILPGLSCQVFRSGHIVGAKSLQLSIDVPGGQKLVTFSGDVGHDRMRTLRGPETPPETDILVLESTYGDRPHEKVDPLEALAAVVQETRAKGGVLVIPAFAVGRAQEILYMLRLLEDEGRIPRLPVILDSPMSSKATDLYLAHTEDHRLDTQFSTNNPENFFPAGFGTVESPDDSMMACLREGPLVIISAAGMLSGGRILHHLKARLPDEKNTVLFAGYQAEGSKGRYLQDKGELDGSLRIHHEEVPVRAAIRTIPALSAHGDAEDLIEWLKKFRHPPSRIFLNHGDPAASATLKARIKSELGWTAEIASETETIRV
jgi:metallo-beta-lactamase family protein